MDFNLPAKTAPYHARHPRLGRKYPRAHSQVSRVTPGADTQSATPRPLGDPKTDMARPYSDRPSDPPGDAQENLAPPSILQVKILTMLRGQAQALEAEVITDTSEMRRAEGMAVGSPDGATSAPRPPAPTAARAPDGHSSYDLPALRSAERTQGPLMDLRNSG